MPPGPVPAIGMCPRSRGPSGNTTHISAHAVSRGGDQCERSILLCKAHSSARSQVSVSRLRARVDSLSMRDQLALQVRFHALTESALMPPPRWQVAIAILNPAARTARCNIRVLQTRNTRATVARATAAALSIALAITTARRPETTDVDVPIAAIIVVSLLNHTPRTWSVRIGIAAVLQNRRHPQSRCLQK